MESDVNVAAGRLRQIQAGELRCNVYGISGAILNDLVQSDHETLSRAYLALGWHDRPPEPGLYVMSDGKNHCAVDIGNAADFSEAMNIVWPSYKVFGPIPTRPSQE